MSAETERTVDVFRLFYTLRPLWPLYRYHGWGARKGLRLKISCDCCKTKKPAVLWVKGLWSVDVVSRGPTGDARRGEQGRRPKGGAHNALYSSSKS